MKTERFFVQFNEVTSIYEVMERCIMASIKVGAGVNEQAANRIVEALIKMYEAPVK